MNATAQPVQHLPAVRKASLVQKFAAKYSIDGEKLLPILKATAFKQRPGQPEVTNEQMAALLVVADQYGLNPFTREIFAFPDKQNGIVPVVSVDGWARILNEDLMMDGLEFRYSEKMVETSQLAGLKRPGHEWIECLIRRKDRTQPIVVREYLEEVYREPRGNYDGPWQTHTKRMHRHKAMIQCARVAFGFAGIFDEDEAHRVIEGTVLPTDPLPIEAKHGNAGLADRLGVDKDETNEIAGAGTATDKPEGTLEKRDEIIGRLNSAADLEVLALVRDSANAFKWTDPDLALINAAYTQGRSRLGESPAV